CFIATCVNGCGQEAIAVGEEDIEGDNQCHDAIGCDTAPCTCNGLGACETQATLIESCPYTISEPGNYFLSGNISSDFFVCLDITATGPVSIDCAWHSINGNPAIGVSSAADLELNGCMITGVNSGINLSGTDSASVLCNSFTPISSSGWPGILISGDNKTVSGCAAFSSSTYAVKIEGSGNTVEGLSVANGKGVLVSGGSGNIVRSSSITSPGLTAVAIESGSNNSLIDNVLISGGSLENAVVVVFDAPGTKITGNLEISGPDLGAIVKIDSSDSVAVSENEIFGGRTGIVFWPGDNWSTGNSTIGGNHVVGGSYTGIDIRGGSNNVVTQNTVEAGDTGIHVSASDTVVSSNTVSDNGDLGSSGIYIEAGSTIVNGNIVCGGNGRLTVETLEPQSSTAPNTCKICAGSGVLCVGYEDCPISCPE
ncbi:MAG: right-handed parallel beta-helix repeat-containing protein, partial [Candidatus Diapherotrites archaeon]|nr:right-handed parallel beta-helix repeat-containing protein [Candidatus Diapherotrites archaeon]